MIALICLTEELTASPSQDLEAQLGEHFYPERGLGPAVPTDALLYRLYEIIKVFGYPLKAIIHEKFGDGIVSPPCRAASCHRS